MIVITILLTFVGLAAGAGGAYTFEQQRNKNKVAEAKKELAKAKKEAEALVKKAQEEAAERVDEARKDEKKRRDEIKDLEQRVLDRQVSLDKKLDELDKRAENLRKGESEVEALKNEIRDIRSKQQEKLEKIAKLSKSDASDKLMQMTERDIRNDLLGLINKIQNEARDNAEELAGTILATTMERMASEVTAERTVTAVKLEDEEMKGRIIGKEGRNIQALQRAKTLYEPAKMLPVKLV
jgi:ribonuclease Y